MPSSLTCRLPELNRRQLWTDSWRHWALAYGLLLLPGAAPAMNQNPTQQLPVPSEIRIPQPRSQYDLSQRYYVELLEKVLKKAANGRSVPTIKPTLMMEQGRATRELLKGDLIDLFWVGTDLEKEQELRAIRIPLERGLMGFRKFTIRADRYFDFDNINNLQQLQQLTACQGAYWPDTDILIAAKLPVIAAPVYENIFKQVVAGRCDYFPRGLHEGIVELKQRTALYPELTRYHDIMLHYPFAVYFFTSKQHEALASWLEQGLEAMINSGELLRHMQQHGLTGHVFPLKHHNAKLWLTLPNPRLPPGTDPTNRRYWFVPADFSDVSDFDKNVAPVQPTRDPPEPQHMQ